MDRIVTDIPSWGYGRSAKTGAYTVVSTDRGYTIDCTSGTFSVSLTAAATLGAGFPFGVYNSGSGTITIDPNGAETIRSPAGSAATLSLSQGQGVLLLCDGTGFEVVASTGIAPSPGSVISGLTPGRVVTAASATTIETPASVTTTQAWAFSSTLTVVDGNFTITGSSDATKTVKFEVDAQSTGADLTINSGAQTADRTLSVPVLTANATLMVLSEAQTVTGAKTFNNAAADVVLNGGTHAIQVSVPAATNRNVLNANGSTTGATFCGFSNTSGSFLMGVNGSAAGFLGASTTAYATVLMSFVAQPLEFGANAICYLRIASTGETSALSTTDATSSSTGSLLSSGGINVAKNAFLRQGLVSASTSTATAGATTTLTISSTRWQIFTGATTQTVQLPAANVAGAGFGPEYIIKNESSGNVTVQRAGADTIFTTTSVTSFALASGQTAYLTSNGSTKWSGFVV